MPRRLSDRSDRLCTLQRNTATKRARVAANRHGDHVEDAIVSSARRFELQVTNVVDGDGYGLEGARAHDVYEGEMCARRGKLRNREDSESEERALTTMVRS